MFLGLLHCTHKNWWHTLIKFTKFTEAIATQKGGRLWAIHPYKNTLVVLDGSLQNDPSGIFSINVPISVQTNQLCLKTSQHKNVITMSKPANIDLKG